MPRAWAGQTVAVLASGPSLTREQCEAVKGRCRVIAVNNQGIDTVCDGQVMPAMAPWAEVLYAADAKWWNAYREPALKFAGLKLTIRSSPHPTVYWLRQSPERVFDKRPEYLVTGGNSGYQALHIAIQQGASRVLLLGFDLKPNGKRKHWFGNHPGSLNTVSNYAQWIGAFGRLALLLPKLGVEVLNCSPDSALKCFRSVPLANAL